MISLVVAYRNEETCINSLLDDIAKQTIDDFEVILINDSSDDTSLSIVNSFIKFYKGTIIFKSITSNSSGKKKAIIQGVESSSGDFLVFTDADCSLPSNFIESYLIKTKDFYADFLIGSVLINSKAFSPIVIFQKIEQIFLQFFFKMSANLNMPIGCSGANYGIYKSLFSTNINVEVSSGDDMFQMQRSKQKKCKFSTIDTIVYTSPQFTLSSFIQQRLRWYRKMNSFKDKDITVFSVILLLLVLFIVLLTLYSFNSLIIAIILSMLIFAIAYYTINKSFSLMMLLSPLLVITYPFYLLFIFFLNNKISLKWKGRDLDENG